MVFNCHLSRSELCDVFTFIDRIENDSQKFLRFISAYKIIFVPFSLLLKLVGIRPDSYRQPNPYRSG